jgi:alpha-amylase/alpha-mannosidase (GH57 family)
MRKSREAPRTSWIVTLVATAIIVGGSLSRAHAAPPIHIAFHWNLHQPVYWPYESVTATASNSRYGFDVLTIHSDRTGPYTAWPLDAVQAGMGAGLENLGASISFSGSLMENLNAMSAAGQGFQNWQSRWRAGAGWTTSLGNRRVEVLAFGYHHAPLALLDPFEIGLQIQLHREKVKQNLGDSMAQSKGLFPPGGAMSERIVSSLVAQGIEWVIVDNIHVDRTAVDYPFTSGPYLPPPNRADQVNSWNSHCAIW